MEGKDSEPFCQAKLLKLPPTFTGHELAFPSPKGVSTRAFQERGVALCVGHPGEDLVGDDLVCESGDLILSAGGNVAGKEDCLKVRTETSFSATGFI